jgi:PTS system mannose-specific IID component
MTIRLRTRAHVFWRCLFLQAAWNRRGMQNLGFAYAIEPALDALYEDPVRREEALARHLGFFNCHPYMAAAILGGAIHHEERVAAGEEPGAAPLSYKATLQGPLAAVGDGFFWTALRPFFGAMAALGALVAGWPAVVAAVLLYNLVHFTLRAVLFGAGYRQGDAVVGVIAHLALPRVAEHLRSAGVALCGAAAAAVALRAGGVVPGTESAAVLVVAAAAGAGYLLLAKGTRLFPAAYLAAMFGTIVAAVTGWDGRP